MNNAKSQEKKQNSKENSDIRKEYRDQIVKYSEPYQDINKLETGVNKLKEAPFWNKLDAVTSNRVYTLGYYGLVNPGSIDAIAKACSQLQAIVSARAQKPLKTTSYVQKS